MAADEDAPFDGALLAAEQRCQAAFQLRYGRGLARPLYERLLAAATGAHGGGGAGE
jgi:hypothetical protein